ncbi:MAG: inositol monophosphatase family protein [Patescibacteria group bacterium]
MKTRKAVLGSVLLQAHLKLKEIKDGGRIVRQGGAFGDAKNDTEIRADKVLGAFIRDRLAEIAMPGRIFVEGVSETGEVRGPPPLTDFYVDPLDGSLNYMTRGPTTGLPHGGCITMTHPVPGRETLFGHIMAAGIVDYRTGELWLSEYTADSAWSGGDDSSFFTEFFPTPPACAVAARTDRREKLDPGAMVVICEMYYASNRARVEKMFRDHPKGWFRNPGSAAYEMALVSTGQAAAYICDQQKHHELGAGYALVKGAGGVVVDFEGEPYDSRPHSFNSQSPVILAANQAIADQILELLRKAG